MAMHHRSMSAVAADPGAVVREKYTVVTFSAAVPSAASRPVFLAMFGEVVVIPE
jgi:hypothetical protein